MDRRRFLSATAAFAPFAALWKPGYNGRIALPEISHAIGPSIIPIGSMAAGKGPGDEKAGVPVDWVWPAEGAISYASGAGIVSHTKNLELAETYLNLMLDPRVQKVIAEIFNYAGSNPETEAALMPALRAHVHMSEQDFSRLVALDPRDDDGQMGGMGRPLEPDGFRGLTCRHTDWIPDFTLRRNLNDHRADTEKRALVSSRL